MKIENFVSNIAEQFEESENINFTQSTNFREIEEWSSLLALSVIAMIDEEYNVKIKGDEIKNCLTIEDLFKTVKSKL